MLAAGDPAWEDLYRLELSGALPAGRTAVRPAARGEVAGWISAAARDPRADPASLARLQRAFARELRRIGSVTPFRETPSAIRLTSAGEARDSLALDGARSELRLGPALSLQARGGDGRDDLGDSTRAGLYGIFLLGRSGALQGELFIGRVEGGRKIGDPLIHRTDVLYFLEEAGAAFATADFRLRLARGRHHWGAGPGESLLLDRNAAPIDFLEWDLALPAGMRFRSWSGSLDVFEERGIAAHRLEIPLSRDLRLSVAEGARFRGGIGHPLYLLGILPYTLVQRLDWQDILADSLRMKQRNNVLAEAELAWRPHPRSLGWLELLVDDVPATNGKSPARLGGRLGVAAMPRLAGAPIDLSLEGTKISRYAYSVYYRDECECDWIHQERAIGEPDGPDQEGLRLRAGRSLGRDHRIELGLLWANHGAGRLGEAWTGSAPAQSQPTRRALEVSAPVERERRAALRWRWDPRDNMSVDAEAAFVRLRHAGNRPGGGWDDRFLAGFRAMWRR